MNSERRTNSRTCLHPTVPLAIPLAIVILALIASNGWLSSALAQSGVGGPNKPINHVGGATTHPNPVVPPAKGVTANAVQPTPTKKK